MNVIAGIEFERTYFDFAVELVHHNAMEFPSVVDIV